MAENLYKWYQDLPPWARGVVVVAGVAGVGVVAWKGFYIVTDAIAKAKAGRALKEVDKDLDAVQSSGQQPSYSEAQYKIWADAAEACYQGWGTCTGDTIFVNLKNDADLLRLIKAFGVRTISSGKWNPEPDLTGDMPTIIRSELDENGIAYVNDTLAKKGIKYRF